MANSAFSTLLDAQALHSANERLNHLGQEMFRMYTEGGFPPDMFLDELEKRIKLPLTAKIYIVSVYQTMFLDHRRKSGIREKNLDKLRRRNREDIERLIETGELGIY